MHTYSFFGYDVTKKSGG